ncbi:MAG: thioredoxin-disulfide reductase [Cyanobacteria bacterium]|nr:thioredoxin-disulfide reductase [Cyanobacteriota bacterium]
MEKINNELLILGSGPAGLGAAIYAYRAGIKFSIVDKFMAGGQIITTDEIDNYPGFYNNISGYDLMQNIISHVKKFGVEIFEFCEITSIKIGKGSLNKKIICTSENYQFSTKTLIFATGASPKRLEAPGEAELIGKGISFCATCDGALYKDKVVAVIGGGNAAIEEALFLTKFASKVYIIHRRDQLRASKAIQDKGFANKKIDFILSSEVVQFNGKERVEEIILKNNKTNKISNLKVDGVFEYVGILPDSQLLNGLVDFDEYGYIITNKNLQTSLPQIFAAGDVRDTPLKQVITAVADGAIAATSVEKYLSGLL